MKKGKNFYYYSTHKIYILIVNIFLSFVIPATVGMTLLRVARNDKRPLPCLVLLGTPSPAKGIFSVWNQMPDVIPLHLMKGWIANDSSQDGVVYYSSVSFCHSRGYGNDNLNSNSFPVTFCEIATSHGVPCALYL